MYIHPEDGNWSVRFEVLSVASMKMAVFWVVVPFSLVDCRALEAYNVHCLSSSKAKVEH
jgi:hypothetical protein